MVIEIAIFYVPKGTGATFAAVWQECATVLDDQPGYRSHRFGGKVEDEDVFILEIEWDSLASHQAFIASPDFAPFFARLSANLDGEPEVFHFEPVPGGRLH